MVYRLWVWGMVGEDYHKIQIVSCASAKITLNNGISTYVKKYPKILFEVGGIQGLGLTL